MLCLGYFSCCGMECAFYMNRNMALNPTPPEDEDDLEV